MAGIANVIQISKQIAMCAIHCFYSSSLSASPTPLLLFSKDEHVIISMCTCKLHKNCEPYMKKTGRDNRSPTAIQPPETHIWSCVRLNRMCLFSVDRVFGSYSNMTVVFPVWCTSWWCFCVGALNFAMRYDWLYCEILPCAHNNWKTIEDRILSIINFCALRSSSVFRN